MDFLLGIFNEGNPHIEQKVSSLLQVALRFSTRSVQHGADCTISWGAWCDLTCLSSFRMAFQRSSPPELKWGILVRIFLLSIWGTLRELLAVSKFWCMIWWFDRAAQGDRRRSLHLNLFHILNFLYVLHTCLSLVHRHFSLLTLDTPFFLSSAEVPVHQ